MSNINVLRAVSFIKPNTTVYTPIVEAVVNAIDAIDTGGVTDGKIAIRVLRSSQMEMEGGLAEIAGFQIDDNGIGFTNEQRDSFDTLYSDLKESHGGKGFGRLTYLKYFGKVRIESVYRDSNRFRFRSFSMGLDKDIIVDEVKSEIDESKSRTSLFLLDLKSDSHFDKKLQTIARTLVEKLLPYFITAGYRCPSISISESGGTDTIVLNDFVDNELNSVIQEIQCDAGTFILKGAGSETFSTRLFKLYFPKTQKSRISLVAHRREVDGTPIHTYIPEFIDEFYEKDKVNNADRERNYIVKVYVFARYLDNHVSLERGSFEFHRDDDVVHGISQTDIEKKAAEIAREAVGGAIRTRQERKIERVRQYVDVDAPWHKTILAKADLSALPLHPSKEDIETALQKEKFSQEMQIKRDVSKILEGKDFSANIAEIVERISGTSKNDLVHYVALRRAILDIFSKSLKLDESGKYSSEGVVHDIIFPRKGSTEITSFHDHNLWIIDERLNFTSYVSSDLPLSDNTTDRPDLGTC